MNTNPFRPPEAAQATDVRETALTPLFVGVTTGIGSWYVVGSLMAQAFSWWLTATGVPLNELFQRMYTSAPYLLVGHALAVPCMALGGFWAERSAGSPRNAAALVSGLFLTLLTLVQFATPYSLPLPWWSRALSLLVPIPAYLLGAAIHRRRASLQSVEASTGE